MSYIAGQISNAHMPSAGRRDERPTEHRCPNCYTPAFGKSAIPCKNEPRRALVKCPTTGAVEDRWLACRLMSGHVVPHVFT